MFERYLGDWKTFNWITYGQMSFIIIIPWLVPESARWLMVKGKTEECLKIIKWIANKNGKKARQTALWMLK